LVSSDLVEKLGLPTRQHLYPYKLQWFNNSGKTKVTKSAHFSFFTGCYHDTAVFDVVPMQACSILLGRPWEFDTDVLHHVSRVSVRGTLSDTHYEIARTQVETLNSTL